jgi:phenylalanine-4-hydroxylase
MTGLTTTKAPIIENAYQEGRLFLEQPYELYSVENHRTWHRLYLRMQPRWRRYANERFLEGLDTLQLPEDRVPRLTQINSILRRLTGFEAMAVSGYIPAFVFFECLHRRQFPTTVTIRSGETLDYLPEPDIFHDVTGHVPMHTDPAFADTLVRFGDCAHTAAEIASSISRPEERNHVLESMIRAMARFFWFTIEFGLMRAPKGCKVYGSGLLSSFGEIAHAVESSHVVRKPLDLAEVVDRPFAIDHFQSCLYVADSFEHVFQLASELERWMRAGTLNAVSPGEPEIRASDIESFLGRVAVG